MGLLAALWHFPLKSTVGPGGSWQPPPRIPDTPPNGPFHIQNMNFSPNRSWLEAFRPFPNNGQNANETFSGTQQAAFWEKMNTMHDTSGSFLSLMSLTSCLGHGQVMSGHIIACEVMSLVCSHGHWTLGKKYIGWRWKECNKVLIELIPANPRTNSLCSGASNLSDFQYNFVSRFLSSLSHSQD